MTIPYTQCDNCGAKIVHKHPEYAHHYCNDKCKSEHRKMLKASNIKEGKRPRGLLYKDKFYPMV